MLSRDLFGGYQGGIAWKERRGYKEWKIRELGQQSSFLLHSSYLESFEKHCGDRALPQTSDFRISVFSVRLKSPWSGSEGMTVYPRDELGVGETLISE